MTAGPRLDRRQVAAWGVLLAFSVVVHAYVEVATAVGDAPVTVTSPFPVTVVPSRLLSRDPRRG